MNSKKFILNDYLYENDVKQLLTEVFEDCDLVTTNKQRRLSFSVPDDVKKITSTQETFTARLPILIPGEEDDVFFFLENCNDIVETFPINPIQTSLDSRDVLLITTENPKLYRIPPNTTADTRRIWIHANIPQAARIRDIEMKLLDWAFTYANLEIIDKKITWIDWKLGNTTCGSTWSAFLKWILCGSIGES
jgi:hypothetical protein